MPITRKKKQCVKKIKKNGTFTKAEDISKDISNDKGIGFKSEEINGESSYKIPPKTCIIKSGIKRILSPYNKFETPYKIISKNVLQSAYYTPGLNNKEKSFIISSFQTKPARYLALKNYATQAISKGKIFTILASGNALRTALVERGWVEKLSPSRMNLDKIRRGKVSSKLNIDKKLERLLLSIMVEKKLAKFIWVTRVDQIDSKEITDDTIINKMKIDGLWTTKYGLCTTTKNNYWFYIQGVAEVSVPRTYAIDNAADIDEFVFDYRLTACTNLLKWVLSMVANNKPVFLDSGKISLRVIGFALNRCIEYLFRKQNKDIDSNSAYDSTKAQWNLFLKKYYRIITKRDVFVTDKENNLPLYMGYAKLLLKEIYKHRPQLVCEGCHNIWIVKPFHNCRGRGIQMHSKLETITTKLHDANSKFVIQKYIEEPLLIHETKFDIRQYYLITSTYPLVIWMYNDCYLKFSTQKYTLENYHEAIHLTNHAVQRKYNNCVERHEELPKENMWDLSTYKQYLTGIGQETVWDNVIYPGMKKSIIAILLACQEQLTVSKNRFELYGCDFILDREFKPWLIEINSGPDLNPTTSVTAKLCPEVLKDIVKVVIDRLHNRKAPTGKFQCIYHQPLTIPRYGNFNDLCIRGIALPNEYFYRGKMLFQESHHSKSTISAMMIKLGKLYGKDITVEPDEYDLTVHRNYYTDRKTGPEGLGNEAVIKKEIFKNFIPIFQVSSNESGEDFIESCMKEVRSFAALPQGILNHNFSKLEDGSSIESSSKSCTSLDEYVHIELHSNKLSPLNLSQMENTGDCRYKDTEQTAVPSSPNVRHEMKNLTEPQSNASIIQEASLKLLDFLNKKEYEYKNCKL